MLRDPINSTENQRHAQLVNKLTSKERTQTKQSQRYLRRQRKESMKIYRKFSKEEIQMQSRRDKENPKTYG